MRQLITVTFLLILSVAWSQTITYDTITKVTEIDNGVFDTTYYVRQHVQIKEKYVVIDTVRGNKWAIDFTSGTSIHSSKTKYIEPDLTYQSEKTYSRYLGGSVYYNFPKNWSIRIGAKFEHHNINIDYRQETKYFEEVYEEVTDTIDTYYYINGSITTYVDVVETRTETRSEERTKYSKINYNWELYFVKIPLQVSYKLDLQKWSLIALLGTSFNFQLSRTSSRTSHIILCKWSAQPPSSLFLRELHYSLCRTHI